MQTLNFIGLKSTPSVNEFYPTDTAALFQTNLQIQPADWKYRNLPIQYALNTWGYRAPEFSTVDWSNAIVIFGCSHVFGVGLHEPDTVSSQLQQLTGRPVINMGVGGSGMECVMYNNGILRANYAAPFAVVNVWPLADRCTEFLENGHVRHHGVHTEDSRYFMTINQKETNQLTRARYQQVLTRALWQDSRTKYFDCSFIYSTSELLDCMVFKWLDRARDIHANGWAHPGSQSTLQAAEIIAGQFG